MDASIWDIHATGHKKSGLDAQQLDSHIAVCVIPQDSRLTGRETGYDAEHRAPLQPQNLEAGDSWHTFAQDNTLGLSSER